MRRVQALTCAEEHGGTQSRKSPPDLVARRAAFEANKGKPIEINVDPSAYTGIGLVAGFVAVAYGYKVTYLGE